MITPGTQKDTKSPTIRIERVDRMAGEVMLDLQRFLAELPASRGVCGEHDPRWLTVLRDGLKHRPIVLLARNERKSGAIQGYLPLALVKSRLFGKFLVSLPYLNRAGIVASNDRVAADLFHEAVQLAGQLDVDYLELRHHNQLVVHDAVTHEKADKVRMVLDLPADAETLWKDLSAKVRNQVRKGDKAGLTIKWGGCDLLDAFYDVFAVNMRDLGTPVYGKRLFDRILTAFAGEAELAVVEHEGQPVAGALLVHEVLSGIASTQVPSASALRAFNSTNANMWMYHHLLMRSIERGSRQFDFGRSSEDSGTYRFKKQWGAQPIATTWQYHLRRGELGAVRPDHPKYRKRIETWQKLPVWLTRMVGPAIVRGIP